MRMNVDCWYHIADQIRDPKSLETMAMVSHQLRAIFTSDRAWRYFNVYDLESGIRDRFIRDMEQQRGLNTTKRLCSVIENKFIGPNTFAASNKFWWCVMNLIELEGVKLDDLYPERCLEVLKLVSYRPRAKILMDHLDCQDKSLWLEALNYNCMIFNVPMHFQNDAEIMLKIIAKDALMAQFASPAILASCEFLDLAHADAELLQFLPDHLRDNTEFVLSCHFETCKPLMYVSERIKSDPEVVFEAIKHLSYEITDPDIGVLDYGPDLRWLPAATRILVWCKLNDKNRSIVPFDDKPSLVEEALKLVSRFPHIYKHTNKLKLDPEFTLGAVRADGLMLEHVPESSKSEEVCEAAVRQNKGAIVFVPEHLRDEVVEVVYG